MITSTPPLVGIQPTNGIHSTPQERGGNDAACPKGHNAEDAGRWGTVQGHGNTWRLAVAPATGPPPCSSRASVAHTATRPRASSQGPTSALRVNHENSTVLGRYGFFSLARGFGGHCRWLYYLTRRSPVCVTQSMYGCCSDGAPSSAVVAKPHFPWTNIVISSDEKRRSSRSLPRSFAAEQPADAPYLSRVVRCAPASDEAPRGPSWPSINRRTRRPKFHDERPATPRCLLALPTEASSFP